MKIRRRGLTLIELLVVLAIVAILIALLVPAVQKVRAAATRVECANHLRQLGIALHQHHNVYNAFPPGMVSERNITVARASGFTFLLPFIEQEGLFRRYRLDRPWHDDVNAAAIGTSVKLFLCPANRTEGGIDLAPISKIYATKLPPFAAGCDYALCRGANGAMHNDPSLIPRSVRGVFGIVPEDGRGLRIQELQVDGTSNTIAIGDAAGGNPLFLVRDLDRPTEAVLRPDTGATLMIEQAWGAVGAGDREHPWFGSCLAVTAQYGLGPEPRDEPMNRRPASPTVYSGLSRGDNRAGKDSISGFRSVHSGGCNFLFCDASVRFIAETIGPDQYRAQSTYAGGETAP